MGISKLSSCTLTAIQATALIGHVPLASGETYMILLGFPASVLDDV